jgi:hypothetical protein
MIVTRMISVFVISILLFGIQLLASGIGQKLPSFTMEDQYSKEVQSSAFK